MMVLRWSVILAVDGGSCMERSARFRTALEAASSILEVLGDKAYTVVGLYVNTGFIPLCASLVEPCGWVVEHIRVVGGRGCWDRGLLEAARLLASRRSIAIVMGCCSLPCDSARELRSVYNHILYFCVDVCPSRLVRVLRERGVDLVTCDSGELVERVRGVLKGAELY